LLLLVASGASSALSPRRRGSTPPPRQRRKNNTHCASLRAATWIPAFARKALKGVGKTMEKAEKEKRKDE